MFVERSTQYTSFSSRKQPANAGTERKQFTENASVALQQPMLTHAHTKCPPVARGRPLRSQTRLAPLAKRSTCSKSTHNPNLQVAIMHGVSCM